MTRPLEQKKGMLDALKPWTWRGGVNILPRISFQDEKQQLHDLSTTLFWCISRGVSCIYRTKSGRMRYLLPTAWVDKNIILFLWNCPFSTLWLVMLIHWPINQSSHLTHDLIFSCFSILVTHFLSFSGGLSSCTIFLPRDHDQLLPRDDHHLW